jgi:hypothetical protein
MIQKSSLENELFLLKEIFMLFGLLFVWLFSLHAQIIEIKYIEEALQYIRPESLCLLDIDNTILEPDNEEQIGSEQWFYSTLQTMQQEMPYEEAKNKLVIYYAKLMLTLSLKLVEDSTTAEILNKISQICTTLGFTARELILAPMTHEWLEHYHIQFNAPVFDKGFIFGEIPILLYNKVIYCKGHKTADTLFTILNHFEIHPTHIVYIDDKEHYLKAIESECARRGIEFIGLRYAYLDKKVEEYLKQAFLNQDEIE